MPNTQSSESKRTKKKRGFKMTNIELERELLKLKGGVYAVAAVSLLALALAVL